MFPSTDTGTRSLFNTALENFPIDFISLSMIAESIASTGAAAQQSYVRCFYFFADKYKIN